MGPVDRSQAVHDFDFLWGNWHIENRRLRSRLTGCVDWEKFTARGACYSILGGSGNVVHRLLPPVHGTFEHGVGEFFGDDEHNGQPVQVHFRGSGITPTSARWEQAFSADGGDTWETNWIMSYSRLEDAG